MFWQANELARFRYPKTHGLKQTREAMETVMGQRGPRKWSASRKLLKSEQQYQTPAVINVDFVWTNEKVGYPGQVTH